jgi:hypothetical protein
VFCVHRSHCHGHTKHSVQAAINASGANGPGRDLILVGAGRFKIDVTSDRSSQIQEPSVFNLVGVGHRTFLTGTFAPSGPSNLSRLRIRVTKSTAYTYWAHGCVGIAQGGIADRVESDSTVCFWGSGGQFRHGVINVPDGTGVSAGDGGLRATLVSDTRITARDGIVAFSDDPESIVVVRRTKVDASGTGVQDVRSISDSQIVMHGGGTGLLLDDCHRAENGPYPLDATNVTLVGDGSPGSTGVLNTTTDPGPHGSCFAHGRVNLSSSIVRGFAVSLKEDRESSGASCGLSRFARDCPPGRHEDNVISASYSDYDPSRVQNDRPVSVDGGHNVNVDPRFVNPGRGDFHLRFDSPVIGAGAPSRPAGLGHQDVDGHRRVVDADHDGQPVIDMGAHEYQGTGPRPAIALNTRRPYVFQDTRFNGVASSDPDGGGLTYRWQFGDRRTATGRHVTHHYTEAGVYRIYLTVRDYQGLRSFTTRTIKVRPAPVLCGHRC